MYKRPRGLYITSWGNTFLRLFNPLLLLHNLLTSHASLFPLFSFVFLHLVPILAHITASLSIWHWHPCFPSQHHPSLLWSSNQHSICDSQQGLISVVLHNQRRPIFSQSAGPLLVEQSYLSGEWVYYCYFVSCFLLGSCRPQTPDLPNTDWILQGSNGLFVTTILETASICVSYLAWRGITGVTALHKSANWLAAALASSTGDVQIQEVSRSSTSYKYLAQYIWIRMETQG